MRYLCLAYGDEKAWNELSKREQDALLAQDEAIRKRGDTVGWVHAAVTTVRAWDGTPTLTPAPVASGGPRLAGFALIEADSVDEVVRLVANTPCARAKGAIEIREVGGLHERKTT